MEEDLIAYLESFLTERRLARNKEVVRNRTNFLSVAIEDVYQLHNTSAVMRSCDVFGVQNLHVIEEVNLKKIDREIAMGAQKWVDIQRYTSTEQCMDHLESQGYQLIATTPHGDCEDINHFVLDRPSVLFFGKETDGLRPQVLERAAVRLKIPMVGFTESLNISVSAAILLQELTNQLRKHNLPWQLSPEEQLALRFEWAKKTLKSHEEITKRYYREWLQK